MNEEIKKLEQVWLVLSDFFQDLSRRNVGVDVASELRNSKTLIYFIRNSILHPPKEPSAIDDSLRNLQQILGKIQSSLLSAALNVDENYARGWMDKLNKAERTELDYTMIHTPSEFVPGLPKDMEDGWVRLTLPKPVAEERVQDVAEQFGVIIEFQNGLRMVISGRRASVKKAAQNIYDLSLE